MKYHFVDSLIFLALFINLVPFSFHNWSKGKNKWPEFSLIISDRFSDNCSWKFGSSPWKGKVDLCMTNGSKVLIYLTLLRFLLHYLQEYSKTWNIEKSNKSELWNRLSYRDLPYHFEVRRKSVRNDCKISRSQPQKFDLDFHSTSTTSKGLSENSKKMSWDNPVFPIDTKNSIGFFVQFFLS